MASLQTSNDSTTGEPSRIRYKGDEVNLGFDVETTAGDDEPTERTAVLDCAGAPIVDPQDSEAFLSIDETMDAIGAVVGIPSIDRVFAFGHYHDGSDDE